MNDTVLPDLSCDAHLHVLGPPARYPGGPLRQYQPRENRFEEYRAMASRLGLARAVLVQPSAYGTDNRAMLDTLREHPGHTRGVAVIDPAVAERFARYVASGAQLRHVVSNLRIDVAGDRAHARCYLVVFLTRNGESKVIPPGHYDCELVREKGAWRFAHRVVAHDSAYVLEGL